MKFWPAMTKRRFVGTLVLVCAMGIVIAALGQFWITNSVPYELGRAAVGNRLGVPSETVSLKRIAPFEFVDGSFSGHANFVLCGTAERCFTVVTKKRDDRWSVVDLVDR